MDNIAKQYLAKSTKIKVFMLIIFLDKQYMQSLFFGDHTLEQTYSTVKSLSISIWF